MATTPGPRDRLLNFYDTRAPTYDTEDPAFHNRLATDFVNWASSYLPPSLTSSPPERPLRHLDLCCGTGLVSFASLAKFGPETEIHGIDYSPRSLDVARAKCPSRTTTVHFHLADVVAGFPPELLADGIQFDLITCCSAFVLLQLPTHADRAILIRQLHNMLTPGGVLLFDVPAPGTQILTEEMNTALRNHCSFDGDSGRGWIKSDSSVEELLISGGFEEELCYVFDSETYKRVEVASDGLLGVWERMVGMPYFAGGIRGVDADKKEKAKEVFIKRVMEMGQEGGKIVDEYRFLIAVARKKDGAKGGEVNGDMQVDAVDGE